MQTKIISPLFRANFLNKRLFVLVWLLGSLSAKAVNLQTPFQRLVILGSAHFQTSITPQSALSQLRKTTTQFSGIITGEVWMLGKFRVSESENYVLEVPNANLDTVQIFVVNDDSIIQEIIYGGDHIPKSQQLGGTQSPFAILTLPKGSHHFLIKYIQKGRYPHPLFKIYSLGAFQEKKSSQLLINGIFAGFCAFLVLLSAVLGLYLRKQIFFLYGIWTCLQCIYYAISLGYFKFWFYPDNTLINSTLRAFISGINPLIFALLVVEYLDQIQIMKKLRSLLHGLLAFCVALMLFERIFTEYFWKNITPWIYVVTIISIIGTIISAIAIVYAFTTRRKPLLIAISFLLQIIITGLLIWCESEPWELDFLELYTYTGFLPILELISFGILMGIRLTETLTNNTRLLRENLLLQTQSQEIHAHTIEEERKRIAMELHDTSLNRLSMLSMLLKSNNIEPLQAGNEASQIGDEIRATAYSLYPPWLDDLNFQEVITRELEHAKKNSKIQIVYTFYDWNTEPSKNQKRHFVRIIQEFLQNTLKHSQATEVNFHFFERDQTYFMEFEDNGIGYNHSQTKFGLGSISVETRITLLQGQISVSSTQGKGVNWLIEVPINPQ